MHLKSLSIRNLHGALSLDVDFRKDVTLLVGINGSGKTSVLTCIEALLRPDMRRLASLDYEQLALTFGVRDETFTVVAEKSKDLVSLSLRGTREALQPLTLPLAHGDDADDDPSGGRYGQLRPEPHERPMWDFMMSLPRPIVITLDRTISAESDETSVFEISASAAARRERAKSPLTYVEEVTSSGFAAYRKRAIAADEELKAEIVMSALQSPDFLNPRRSAKALTRPELERLEEKVVSYLTKTVKAEEVANRVRAFFKSSSRLGSSRRRTAGRPDLVLDMLGSRYRQIESLAKAFNTYETKNAAAFAKLRDYLSAVNQFLVDSGKELFFDESTNKLVFSFVSDSARDESRRGIKHLSSGERQILILFTFLAFASTSSTVFIVDEPELSLHPKWQHEFMGAFLKLKPAGAQVLLATHSPEIVGKHRSACVSLSARRRRGGQ